MAYKISCFKNEKMQYLGGFTNDKPIWKNDSKSAKRIGSLFEAEMLVVGFKHVINDRFSFDIEDDSK